MTGQTISHYRVLELLGEGGMGVVYKAEDMRLGRIVALKILSKHSREDQDRFLREAKASAALDHPNICAVHEIGEHEGCPYIVMSFVDGLALKQKIAQRPLKLGEALDIAIQAGEGLQAAHQRGLVHRDIKPGNLMVTPQGQVKLLDFGLAKFTDETRITATGCVVGTPSYMSPEQARGGDVDRRTDIWSLGVVLYEMLAGRAPFGGDSAPTILRAILDDQPEPVTALRSGLPLELDRILGKALAKDQRERYQHIEDLLVDLRALQRKGSRPIASVETEAPTAAAATTPAPIPDAKRRWYVSRRGLLAAFGTLAAVLAVTAGLKVASLRGWRLSSVGAPPIESLAVLPLDNLSGDPNQEFFANGMTEALIDELSRIKALKKVISRTSVMQYKGTRKPSPQIARELGVDALIEGSVLREGNVVRVAVQLIDGGTDAHLWTDRFDREYKNILELHSDVARAIAQEIKVALSPQEAANPAGSRAVNPEAYDYYLRGLEHSFRSQRETDLRLAIQMFQKAASLDPSFAPTFAALSEAHGNMWWYYHDRTRERTALAKAAADRAQQLGPSLPETHRAVGYYYYHCLLKYDHALQELEKARETKPNDVQVLMGIGAVLRRQGRFEQSLVYGKKAIELDPLSATLAVEIGMTCAMLRNLPEASRYFATALKLDPGAWLRLAMLIHLRLSGESGQAGTALERVRQLGMSNEPDVAYAGALLDLYSGAFQRAAARLDTESWQIFEDQFQFVPKSLLQAQLSGLLNQPQPARSYYDAARKIAEAKVQERPDEANYHSALGIAYAGLGRKGDAIREGKAGASLLPVSLDAFRGPCLVEDLARIYAMVGEQEAAIGQLEYLMSIPGTLGAGALRLDPAWNPLRQNPRFKALLSKYAN